MAPFNLWKTNEPLTQASRHKRTEKRKLFKRLKIVRSPSKSLRFNEKDTIHEYHDPSGENLYPIERFDAEYKEEKECPPQSKRERKHSKRKRKKDQHMKQDYHPNPH